MASAAGSVPARSAAPWFGPTDPRGGHRRGGRARAARRPGRCPCRGKRRAPGDVLASTEPTARAAPGRPAVPGAAVGAGAVWGDLADNREDGLLKVGELLVVHRVGWCCRFTSSASRSHAARVRRRLEGSPDRDSAASGATGSGLRSTCAMDAKARQPRPACARTADAPTSRRIALALEQLVGGKRRLLWRAAAARRSARRARGRPGGDATRLRRRLLAPLVRDAGARSVSRQSQHVVVPHLCGPRGPECAGSALCTGR